MKKTIALSLSVIAMLVSACAPRTTPTTMVPTEMPTVVEETPTVMDEETPTAVGISSPTPTDIVPTLTVSAADQKQYTNSTFNFGFSYPADWYGPDEYVSDNVLRVAVGSDVVYPYGEVPAMQPTIVNSYQVVLQYTKNNQNSLPNETYDQLANLQDGESQEDGRNLTTRVRALQLGRFDGFEYITTLSETAQTEHFYMRQVLLVDKVTNDVITVMGQPNNVEVTDPATWRDVYMQIDQYYWEIFQSIVESITAEPSATG